MINAFYPVEIHTHTEHSDGIFSVTDLIASAKAFGYKGIILTDHNSSSGYAEMAALGLLDDDDLVVLKGIEWTTYFGHMLAHDADYDVDWREAIPDNIDPYMREVRAAHGLVGIAHPFDMGSPMCTGCHWDYQVQDYGLVNYIEVWNSNHPQRKRESESAYQFWLERLEAGERLSCSTGRDWHGPDNPEENMGVTYVGVAENRLTAANFKQALAGGHFYITLGPTLGFQLQTPQATYHMGDNVPATAITEAGAVKLEIGPTEIEWLQKFPVADLTLRLRHNEAIIFEETYAGPLSTPLTRLVPLTNGITPGYLRVEVQGQFGDDAASRIILSNPIYLL